jgi:HSP20 family molecular chaperone IbpA
MDKFFDNFLKAINLKFSLPNKDVSPIHTEKTSEGYRIIARSVGIAPEDVKIELKDECIHLEGKTEKNGMAYSTSYDIPLLDDIRDNIENIKYKSENGMTTIYINTKKRLKEIVDIKRID